MPNQKLLDITRHLDAEQLKRFSQFVDSPYFNHTYHARQLSELLAIVIDHPQRKRIEDYDKEQLQRHFFPDKPFYPKRKNTIDMLASDLNKLARRFVTIEEMMPEIENQEPLHTARFFRKHEEVDRFWQEVNGYRKQWDKRSTRDATDYYERFLLEEEVASFIGEFTPKAKDDNIHQANGMLDKAYTIRKLELGFSREYKQLHLPKEQQSSDFLLEAIIGNYLEQEGIHSLVSDLFFLANRVLKNPKDVDLLIQYEKALQDSFQKVPPAHFRNLLIIYRSFVIRKYRLNGETKIRAKLLELYRSHLEAGYLEYEGKLTPNTFRRLINLAIWEKEYDWARHILTSYPPERIAGTRYPQEFHNLSMGDLLFAEGKFDDAEEHLIYRQYQDPTYSILSDILLVMIYYQTDNDLLEGRIRAVELKIRRARISQKDQEGYLNFIGLLRKIIKYKWVNKKDKLIQVEESIRSGIPLVKREWLLSIIQK